MVGPWENHLVIFVYLADEHGVPATTLKRRETHAAYLCMMSLWKYSTYLLIDTQN